MHRICSLFYVYVTVYVYVNCVRWRGYYGNYGKLRLNITTEETLLVSWLSMYEGSTVSELRDLGRQAGPFLLFPASALRLA